MGTASAERATRNDGHKTVLWFSTYIFSQCRFAALLLEVYPLRKRHF
jgi:hypothetical protein